MTMTIAKSSNTLIVKLTGELDHHISEEIRVDIDHECAIQHAKNIIFDFSEVTFMDSSGIGMVIGRYKNAKKIGGIVAVASVADFADRVFEISGIYKIVKKYNTVEDAVKAM